jgi:hypothetical protein
MPLSACLSKTSVEPKMAVGAAAKFGLFRNDAVRVLLRMVAIVECRVTGSSHQSTFGCMLMSPSPKITVAFFV